LAKLPDNCPVCGNKLERGYVSASPDIYWSEEKIKFLGHWEALLGGHFGKWIMMVNAEASRCPDCKIVLFAYKKEQRRTKP